MGTTIRRLAEAIAAHAGADARPSFSGDGAAALRALADDYDRRVSDRGVRCRHHGCVDRTDGTNHSSNCSFRQASAALRPSLARMASNSLPTSVSAA